MALSEKCRNAISCSTAAPAQDGNPSSMTASTWPEAIPSRRRGLLGRTTGSTAPPHSSKVFRLMPWARSAALMAKLTQSLSATETLRAGRRRLSSSMERTPNLRATATTSRSLEGNTARARSGSGRRKGPRPRYAMEATTEGLSQPMSILPRPTKRAPRTPLHQAGLTAMVKAKGGPPEAEAPAPGSSTESLMALVMSVGTVS